jgi:hypothetical protein
LPFLAAAGLFVFLALVSVAMSLDPARSAVAFADLMIVSFLGYCIARQVLEEPERGKLVLRAVTFALIVYAAFCVGELIAWGHGMAMQEGKPGSWVELTFAPQLSEFYVPRPSGATVDPNRAGFVLMMYLILLDQFVAKSRYTRALSVAIAVFILLTMSRSAIMCWVVYYAGSRAFWRRLLSRRTLLWLAAGVAACALVAVAYQKEVETLLEVYEISDALSARLSVNEAGSGQNHILLIQRGIETWSSSAKNMVAGIGLASAPKVLYDFFGDNKQGNFHCLYVTVLAEIGLPAFLVLLFLFGYPIAYRKGAAAGMLVFIVFNISYQSHMEPLFWIVLPILWSCEVGERKKVSMLVLRDAIAT